MPFVRVSLAKMVLYPRKNWKIGETKEEKPCQKQRQKRSSENLTPMGMDKSISEVSCWGVVTVV